MVFRWIGGPTTLGRGLRESGEQGGKARGGRGAIICSSKVGIPAMMKPCTYTHNKHSCAHR